MPLVSLQAEEITKTFSRRKVFAGVSFSVAQSQTLAIIGRNGSGKSTLVKILAGVLSATSGNVIITLDGRTIARAQVFHHIGFVAPYLQLYDEFTALENLMLFKRLRGLPGDDDAVHELLKRVSLHSRKDDIVRTYSSGMKQRLKYAFALLHRPPVLLLDEPRTNLDSEGIDVVYALIDEQRKHGLTIIASNDREDTELCDAVVSLNGSPAPAAGGRP